MPIISHETAVDRGPTITIRHVVDVGKGGGQRAKTHTTIDIDPQEKCASAREHARMPTVVRPHEPVSDPQCMLCPLRQLPLSGCGAIEVSAVLANEEDAVIADEELRRCLFALRLHLVDDKVVAVPGTDKPSPELQNPPGHGALVAPGGRTGPGGQLLEPARGRRVGGRTARCQSAPHPGRAIIGRRGGLTGLCRFGPKPKTPALRCLAGRTDGLGHRRRSASSSS